jgi:hypothetical protein
LSLGLAQTCKMLVYILCAPGHLLSALSSHNYSSLKVSCTFLDKNAQIVFDKPFADLTPEQAAKVAGDTVDSAGRPNKGFSSLMRAVGTVSKVLIIIATVVSVYQVVTADDWKVDQVAAWSGTVMGGVYGAEFGVLIGLVGAVVGNVTRGLIGGLTGENQENV